MSEIITLKDFKQIELLADANRLTILRLLMAGPATLTQLGRALGKHPAWVRHHLKQLEQVDLVEMRTARVSGGFVEKYYQAKARAFYFQEMILPEAVEKPPLLLLGSHDLALNILARQARQNLGAELIIHPVGSLEGLIALRQGVTHLTGCHLWDAVSGEFNLGHIRYILPDRMVKAITLAQRTQGLMVAAGNPHGIHSVEDLGRGDVILVNRNPGSGTRLWLDEELKRLGIPPGQVRGYRQEAWTHNAVAQAIQNGTADVGLGLEAAARQAKLDFLPLFEERYDLVMSAEQSQNPMVQRLLDYLQTRQFRRLAAGLGGYDPQHSGEQVI